MVGGTNRGPPSRCASGGEVAGKGLVPGVPGDARCESVREEVWLHAGASCHARGAESERGLGSGCGEEGWYGCGFCPLSHRTWSPRTEIHPTGRGSPLCGGASHPPVPQLACSQTRASVSRLASITRLNWAF